MIGRRVLRSSTTIVSDAAAVPDPVHTVPFVAALPAATASGSSTSLFGSTSFLSSLLSSSLAYASSVGNRVAATAAVPLVSIPQLELSGTAGDANIERRQKAMSSSCRATSSSLSAYGGKTHCGATMESAPAAPVW